LRQAVPPQTAPIPLGPLKKFVESLQKLKYNNYQIVLIILETFATQFPGELIDEIREKHGGNNEEDLDCSIIYEEINIRSPTDTSLQVEFEQAESQENLKTQRNLTTPQAPAQLELETQQNLSESEVDNYENPKDDLIGSSHVSEKQDTNTAEMTTVLLGERKLPIFMGEKDESFREFFQKFEAYRGHFKLTTEEEVMPHFQAALKGDASKLVKLLLQADKKTKYRDICAALRDCYCHPTKLSTARQKLYNAQKKKTESMQQYLLRLIDIVTSTEESEGNTKEMNEIIVEKLVKALPVSIYREMIKKEELTPLTVIPQALELIREAPDEKECMRVIRGVSGKDTSDSSPSSDSDSEDEENKKRKKRMEKLLKDWTEKKNTPKVQEEPSKKEERNETVAALAKEIEKLSINLVQWQESQKKQKEENKQEQKPEQPNNSQQRGGRNNGWGGYRGGQRGRGYYQQGYQHNYQQPQGQSNSQMGYFPNPHQHQAPQQQFQQGGQMPLNIGPPPQQWATMGGHRSPPFPQQHYSNMPQYGQSQGERKRCWNCNSTWHLSFNCDKPKN